MRQVIIGARLLVGGRLLDDHALLIDEGGIEAVLPVGNLPTDATLRQLDGGLLAPGLVDLQVNGGGGVLLNDEPTVDGIAAIARAHRRLGTTALLPTFITDAPERAAMAVAAVREAIASGVPGILGIHLEGPFISPKRKGIHNIAAIRRPGDRDLALLTSLGIGRTLVTLAPEEVPPGTIRRLADAGVIVSAGHTAASYAQMQAALEEGLSSFTHLYNAMRPSEGREPGVVGAALDAPDVYCGLIADGHHVHPANLRLAFRAKGADRLYLVSDAMSTVGTEVREFDLYGRRILRQEGRLVAEDGTLAGADIDLAGCVRRAVRLMGISVEEALTMATATPAACLGIEGEYGRIAPGCRADLVHLSDDLELRGCWIAGEEVAG